MSSAKSNDQKVKQSEIIDATVDRFTLADNTVPSNPNQTIGDDFSRGILPQNGIKGEIIRHNFNPVYFAFNMADINSREQGKLRMLAGFLESNPNLYLVVEGHSDEKGSAEYNRALSQKRAISVKQTLGQYSQGIATRISTVGYGEEKPSDNSDTNEAHAKNRRAELVIISKR
ncbi:MAG: OmpA family protein [Lentisphaeraceae bacterium]|nr:OmpA family protein [Lentisphaeraceae bacterium]